MITVLSLWKGHIARRPEAMFEMLCAGHTKADIARFFRLDRSCVYHASKAIPARLEAQAA